MSSSQLYKDNILGKVSESRSTIRRVWKTGESK